MERLNEIISQSTQRQQQSPDGHAAQHMPPTYGARPQSQRPMQAGQPFHRRPTRQLSEQMAYQGRQYSYTEHDGQQSPPHAQQTPPPPPPRMRPTREEGTQHPQPRIAHHLSQSATRPLYQRQRPTPGTPSPTGLPERESNAPRSFYEVRKQAGQPRSHDQYYHQDEYMPAPHADALQNDEDDETGIQYGYWNGEENDDQGEYQQPEATRYSQSPVKTPMVREPYAAPEVERRTYVTRNLQELQRGTPVPPPAAPAVPVTRVQEIPNYQRRTQPLNPQMVADLQQERNLPQAPQQTSRQMVARDSLKPLPLPSAAAVPLTKTVCPKCKGAGYLRANVPFGHPNFGKPVACECKEAERHEKRRQQLIELSDLGAFRQQTFHNFSTNFPGIHPSVIEAYEEARNFAQNPSGWLILIGPNGCGKTHLAAAIANQSLNVGDVVLFSVVPELLDHLRGAFAPSATEVYDQLFSKMREAGLLVLDDLGAHYGTPWATEKLYQLLNYRYSWRMPTVITTNNLGLQAIDPRLRSRMMDNSLVVTVNLERARDCRPYLPRHDN